MSRVTLTWSAFFLLTSISFPNEKNKQTKLNKQSTQLVDRWYRAEPDSSAELQSFHPMQFLHWYRFYPSIWAVKFLCTECETHRFGSCIDAPPQTGVCLTYFPSTVPESFSYSMTWYTSCRWLAAPLVPCLLVHWSVEWDSLLGYMSTSAYRGVGLQGTCSLARFLAAAQRCWPLPHCKPQHLDMPPAQGPVHSFVLFIGKEETWEDWAICKLSYAKLQSILFAKAGWFEKFVRIFLPACIKYSGKSSASSNIFLVLCCIWINESGDSCLSGLVRYCYFYFCTDNSSNCHYFSDTKNKYFICCFIADSIGVAC